MNRDGAVDGENGFASADQLAGVVQAVFGAGRRITGLDRLPNGSKKGVYRLTLDDRETVVVYLWNESEDYWHGVLPEAAADPANPFSHASGLDLFEAASRRLESLGVRSPRLLLADRSRALYPADIAVVEDIVAGTLEGLLDRDPAAAESAMARLADSLDAMHRCQAPRFGKVALVDGGGTSAGKSCEQAVLDRALAETAEIAAGDPRAAADQAALEDKVRELAARVEPRSEIGLIHGELGPDHVLVDRHGEPVLIDIEGLMYFDVEWEHVFLRLRFGDHYQRLHRTGLDEHRLRFYQLAMHLDLVAGPRRIAQSGHPDRAWFLDIADYHLQRAVEFAV